MSPKDFIMALALFGQKFPDREYIGSVIAISEDKIVITSEDEDGEYNNIVNVKTKTVN